MPCKLTKRTKLLIFGVVGVVILIAAGVVAAVVLMKAKSNRKGADVNGPDPRIRTDYCLKELCKKGKGKHIGCEHNGQFADTCQEAVMVDITPARQIALIHEHNLLRNEIAGGNLPGFQPAKRMPRLVWDDELAYLAELNAKQCKMLHDPCRAVDRFRHSGQNLAIESHRSGINIDEMMVPLVTKWYDENYNATQEDVDIYPGKRPPGEQEIGHFTLLVTEKSRYVGCGASIYRKLLHSGHLGWEILLACNYSYTNMKTQPIYRKGPTCSECITPCQSPYNALCSGDEGVPPVPD